MTNLNIVENKISSVKKYLTICQRYSKYSQETIENDIDVRGMVERYLFLVTQATIDLAESFVSYKGFRKPTTMSEAFYVLEEEGIIENKLTKKMVAMTGFRNIMTHDYEKVDYGIVYTILHKGIKDLEQFLKLLEDGQLK